MKLNCYENYYDLINLKSERNDSHGILRQGKPHTCSEFSFSQGHPTMCVVNKKVTVCVYIYISYSVPSVFT